MGQYLMVNQKFLPRNRGFTGIKLDLPESWQIASVNVVGRYVVLKTVDGRVFKVGEDNIWRLSDTTWPKLSDEDLDSVWTELALDKAALRQKRQISNPGSKAP